MFSIIIIIALIWVVLSFFYILYFKNPNEKNILVVNDNILTEPDAIKTEIIAMPKKFAVKIILSDEQEKSIINDNVMVDMVLRMDDLLKGDYTIPEKLRYVSDKSDTVISPVSSEYSDDDYIDVNSFNF